jgi:type VI secretion system protein ImpB
MEVDVQGGGDPLAINLTFESLDDFSPTAVARKVDSLRRLLELRTQLTDVRARFAADPDAKEKLKSLFNQIMSDPALAAELREKLGSSK